MLKYKEFINPSEQYLYGKITFEQWVTFQESKILNEGLSDWLKSMGNWINGTVIKSIGSWFKNILNFGTDMLLKIYKMVKWIIDTIEKFKEKHKFLYYVILAFVVVSAVIAFLIITSNQVKAGDLNQEVVKQNWDQLIGYIQMKITNSNLEESQLKFVNQACQYLADQKDGILGNNGFQYVTDNISAYDNFAKTMSADFKDTINNIEPTLKEQGKDVNTYANGVLVQLTNQVQFYCTTFMESLKNITK